jgi:hypothetical protein
LHDAVHAGRGAATARHKTHDRQDEQLFRQKELHIFDEN